MKWSWTAPADGTYILEYGIANSGDAAYDSRAMFDALVLKSASVCTQTSPLPTGPTDIGTFSPGLFMSWDPMVIRPFGLEDSGSALTGRLWLPCWSNGNVDVYVVVSQSPYGQLVLSELGQWLPFPANIVPWYPNTPAEVYAALFSYLKSSILPGSYKLDVIVVPSGTPASTISQIVSGTATVPYYRWSFTKSLS